MKVFIVGGTGFIGYYATLEFLNRGDQVSTISIPDVELGEWFPKEVHVTYGNIFEMSHKELVGVFRDSDADAMVYAVGPDDRVKPKGPKGSAYEFFCERLVEGTSKVVAAARDAGVKRCVVLNSYFAYFDRIWPEKRLAEHHPYIKCRIEQAERAIYEGKDCMDVIILELPYIFGVMPGRVPLWKDILVDMLQKMPNILFPRGGTNMIAVENVAEAIVGAIYNGKAGTRYPIGDINMSWKEMLGLMLKGLGLKKKILTLPNWIANLFGRKMKWDDRRHGVEGGLDPVHLFKDIMTKCLYFDSEAIANHLGYSRGNVRDAIEKTMHACLPQLT